MVANPIPTDVETFARAVGPQPDPVIEEMDERADREGFPTVGPAVGGWLQVLVGLVDARRVFEFGSGFGYSAYWFARGLPEDGEIVLTEVDADELADAERNLARGGFESMATFEPGDALETVADYEGPFDVSLIDIQKRRYADAFEAIRDEIPAGGVVVADNAVTAGSIDFGDLTRLLDGESVETGDGTRGIADYLELVSADPAFETVLLPLGEGVAVSYRRE